MLAPLPQVAVYFLCRVRVGMHVSQTAGPLVARLEKDGFKQAVKLKGGMGQWEADSLPVVTR